MSSGQNQDNDAPAIDSEAAYKILLARNRRNRSRIVSIVAGVAAYFALIAWKPTIAAIGTLSAVITICEPNAIRDANYFVQKICEAIMPSSSDAQDDETAWLVASRLDTQDSYQDYLQDFPTGRHANEAKNRMEFSVKRDETSHDVGVKAKTPQADSSGDGRPSLKPIPPSAHTRDASEHAPERYAQKSTTNSQNIRSGQCNPQEFVFDAPTGRTTFKTVSELLGAAGNRTDFADDTFSIRFENVKVRRFMSQSECDEYPMDDWKHTFVTVDAAFTKDGFCLEIKPQVVSNGANAVDITMQGISSMMELVRKLKCIPQGGEENFESYGAIHNK